MPEGEVVLRYVVCRSCGVQADHDGPGNVTLEIQRIEAGSESGKWTASGSGTTEDRNASYCPNCGLLCSIITHRLPAELQDLPCPGCGGSGAYTYALDWVQLQSGMFSFTASVACSKCTSKSVFRKLIASLSRIRRVKVGPGGLELEVSNQARN